MKVKRLKLSQIMLFGLSVLCGLCLAMALVPTSVYAETTSTIKVGITAGGTSTYGHHSIAYPQDNKGTEQTLYISGYSGGGKVEYSILKEGSGSFVFDRLGEPVEITAENPNGSFKYNFFAGGGVGKYRIKAMITDTSGGLQGQNMALSDIQELVFTINQPANNQLDSRIEYQQIGTTENDLPQFSCRLNVASGAEEVDLSNYDVEWYYDCNEKGRVYFATGQQVVWNPQNVGTYKLFAQVSDLGIDKQKEVGELTKNFSTYAIIALSAFGAVLTVIVIWTTVRKVKKERVW